MGTTIEKGKNCVNVRGERQMCHNPTMSQNQPVEYEDVAEALRRAASSADPADCHGLMCGLICASGFADPKAWVAEVFEDFNPRDLLQAEAFRLLQQLNERALASLHSPDMDFELLLPDDEQPLRERTEALGAWCAGFLSGLGLGGIADQQQLSHELRELLDDMSHIAKVDFELDDVGEEEQVAFVEVVEYIRVGVLFIHEELQASQIPSRIQ